MERYLKIVKVNWKHHLFPYVVISFIVCVAAPLFVGTENLNIYQTAKVIEMYLSLLGILLLLPVFLPDVNQSAGEVIRTKKEPMITLYHIRLFQSILFLIFFGIIFLVYLKRGGCEFSIRDGMLSFLANACFLGGIGMLAFSLTDQIVFAYMLPILYYILNFGAGGKYWGKFYLFSMQAGHLPDKFFLLMAGILCMELSIYHKRN